tara:strand:+ start:382 stop:555 length:174 start_codon:yes stop_codon:yes gene_type:complete
MSNEGSSNRSGKYRQPYDLPLDNPEIPDKKDWWQEICDAAGEKNHWSKDKKKKSDTN